MADDLFVLALGLASVPWWMPVAMLLTAAVGITVLAWPQPALASKSPLCPQCNGLGTIIGPKGESVTCGLRQGSGLK